VAHPTQVRFLKLMFAKACKAQLLGLNVWAVVELPDRSKGPRLPPTTAGLGRMVACARERGGWWPHFAECLIFAAHSGLRREEVERVETEDVLDAGARLVVRGKRRPGEERPRTRVVALLGPSRAALLSEASESGRVWRAEKGGPLSQDVVDRCFKSLAVEVNVDSTFHGLRHYCSSWLLDAGASRMDVAIQLGHVDDAGHVDVSQVQERYGHMAVEPALQRLAAATTDGGGSGVEGRGEGRGAAGD
jgi:integrase